ncbi:MAG: T9SS type A sorting domain-containing protein [Lewinella sp.]|nr:T9SS type A sorting domain-containing protein [Lewinella sp.]
MRNNFTLLVVLLTVAVSGLQAQDNRFIDPIYDVSAPTLDTFGANIDVYELARAGAGDPNATPNRPLEMDVYQPVGDEDLSLRPVVVFFHTGNFLPQYVNQGLYGTIKDSIVVQMANEVASRGYVGMSATYRFGWNPRGDVDVRTSTLLQAAYRGGQDAHMMARYLRKSVAEDGNPYRIDTSRIVFWGIGTGGYVTMTHAYLDDVQEVLDDERFYDQNDVPYVNITVNSDPQGLMFTEFAPGIPSNIPNHAGYSSHVAMSINSNGALGDVDWIDGTDNEPITLGYHSTADIFAPFSYGDVIVPTTMDLVIGCVAGTEQIVETANMMGNNDAIIDANATDLPAIFSDLSRAINVVNAGFKTINIMLDNPAACSGQTFDPTYQLSHDNMYPWQNQGLGAPYNWVNQDEARARIAAFNGAGGDLNADVAIGGENAVNPNAFNPAAAKLVVDTMVAHFIPRAYIGMGLETLVSTEEVIANSAVGLEVFPNPVTAGFTVQTEAGHTIRTIRLMDINGRVVTSFTNVNANTRYINRGNLPRGVYILQLQLDEGTTAQKLILD